MKNTVKKTCLALLCAVLSVSVLASCGKGKTETDKDFSLSTLTAVDPNTIPASSKEFSDVPPGTYTVLCHVPSGDLLSFTGESEDIVDRRIYLRNAELKEKYSIELKELTITGKTVDFVRNSTLSGLVTYDIASLTYGDAMLLTVSNSLCALSELGGYYQNIEMFSVDLSVGGKQYIVDLDLFAPVTDATYALAVNRAVMADTGLTDAIFSVAARGDLTLEYLGRVAAEKGAVSLSGEGLDALWAGGGVHFFENGLGDVPAYKSVGTEAENVYSALKHMSDNGILADSTDYDSGLSSENADGDFIAAASKNLFTVGTVAQIESALRSGLEVDLLPMPKVDSGAKYASLVSRDALCTAVPSGDDEKNSIAFALTGMLYGYSLSDAAKEELESLVPRAEARTGEIFDIISSSRTFDLPALYDMGGLYDYLGSSLRYNLLPDAFIEGINDRAQTAVVAIEIMRENQGQK